MKNQHANNMCLSIGSAEVFGEGEYKKPSNDAPDDLSNSTGKADSQSNVPLETSTPHRSHSHPLVLMRCVHSLPQLWISAIWMALEQRRTKTGRSSPTGILHCLQEFTFKREDGASPAVGSHGLGTTSRGPPRPLPTHERADTVCKPGRAVSGGGGCGATRWHGLEGTAMSVVKPLQQSLTEPRLRSPPAQLLVNHSFPTFFPKVPISDCQEKEGLNLRFL